MYDAAGRVAETRRWGDVALGFDAAPEVGADGFVIMRLAGIARPLNAWDGEDPAPNLAWSSNGQLPQWTTDGGTTRNLGSEFLSYSRSEYDDAGRVYRSYALSLDSEGKPVEVLQSQYDYDDAGKQTEVISLPNHSAPERSVTTTSYEGNRRDSVTDGKSEITSFDYDALGRVMTTTLPDAEFEGSSGADATYLYVEYDGLGRKVKESKQTSINDPESSSIAWKTFHYDLQGRLIAVDLPQVDLDPHGTEDLQTPMYDYIYDVYGNQVGILDAKDRLTVFKYDHLHRQVEKFMPFAVDPCDITDAASVYTELDALATEPDSETQAYDAEGRLDIVSDYEKQITEFVYDGRGRLEYKKYYAFVDTNEDAENDNYVNGTPTEGYQYVYDALGRQDQVKYLYNDTGSLDKYIVDQDFTYDVEGRVIQIVSNDDPLVDDDEGILHYDYDVATGRKVSTWTGINIAQKISRTDYRYDDLGRLAEVEVVRRDNADVSGEVTSYTYDKNGNRLTMDLPNSIDTAYTYDALNRLTNVNHEVSETTKSSFAYTLAADGQRVSVQEQVEMVYPNPPTATHDHHEKIYTHDALNRLVKEIVDETDYEWENPTQQYEVRYEYDLAGNRKKRQVDAGGTKQETSYSYDAATDRLTQESTQSGWVAHLENDEYPVYLADNNGEKDSQRLVWLKMPSRWWGVGLWAVLATMLTLLLLPQILPNSGKRRLRAWYRGTTWLLVAAFIIGPLGLEVMATTDTQYEQLSSRMAKIWSEVSTTITYTYDANGSMTQKDVSGGTDAHWVDYDYNLQGRLAIVSETRVKNFDSGGTANDHEIKETSYFYNADGIKMRKEYRLFYDYNEADDLDGPSDRVQQGSTETTDYLIDPANHTGYAQVLEETIDDGSQVDRISYTIGDDVLAETVSTDIGEGGTPSLGDAQYLIYDGHGSVRHRADINGSGDLNEYTSSQSIEYNTYQYDAYGNSLIPQTTDGLGYAGEMWDNDAQHYYNRARWYNPSNGRFNRVDPFGGNNADPQSLHKYLYAHANPVNGIDPSGKLFNTIARLAVTGIQAIIRSFTYYAGAAYLWAGMNIALLTSITYYAMWTFIIASIWSAAEQLGYAPSIRLVGDWTVANALQVVSGVGFIIGLMIIGSVPDLERVRISQLIQQRTYELRQQLATSHRFGATMAVGVGEKNGVRMTLLATNEQGLYTRPGVALGANERLVSGSGHAEQRIVQFCQEQNIRLFAIGATRPVCTNICVPAITPTGADIATPIKAEHLIH